MTIQNRVIGYAIMFIIMAEKESLEIKFVI